MRTLPYTFEVSAIEGFHCDGACITSFNHNNEEKPLQISFHDFFGASLTELSDLDREEVCLYVWTLCRLESLRADRHYKY
jgi:hypothetical protein